MELFQNLQIETILNCNNANNVTLQFNNRYITCKKLV